MERAWRELPNGLSEKFRSGLKGVIEAAKADEKQTSWKFRIQFSAVSRLWQIEIWLCIAFAMFSKVPRTFCIAIIPTAKT